MKNQSGTEEQMDLESIRSVAKADAETITPLTSRFTTMKWRCVCLFLALLAVSLITGCQLSRGAFALMHSTDHLIALPSDHRVRYEPGAELLAQKVAASLSAAIHQVEEAQYVAFKAAVVINVYATPESFSSHSATPVQARGAQFNGAIHLSPLLNGRIETLASIVTHELSHFHLQQFGGGFGITPPWFEEGLAVIVSKGAGAEKVTEAEAVKAIISGQQFVPELSGGILTYKGASYYGLQTHMFYRQSAMFVAYLQQINPAAFKTMYLALTRGDKFEEAFSHVYQQPISQLWRSFIASIAST